MDQNLWANTLASLCFCKSPPRQKAKFQNCHKQMGEKFFFSQTEQSKQVGMVQWALTLENRSTWHLWSGYVWYQISLLYTSISGTIILSKYTWIFALIHGTQHIKLYPEMPLRNLLWINSSCTYMYMFHVYYVCICIQMYTYIYY